MNTDLFTGSQVTPKLYRYATVKKRKTEIMTTLKTPHKLKSMFSMLALAGVIVLAGLALLTAPVQAQADPTPGAPAASAITFNGVVESIGPRFIVVNGLLVDLQNAVVAQPLELNATVTVVGNLQNNVVLAAIVQPYSADDSVAIPVTATPVPVVTSTPSSDDSSLTRPGRFVIQGPVRAITADSIRIFSLEISLTPNTLRNATIRVGDSVRVVGEFTILNNEFRITAVNITPVTGLLGRGSSDTSMWDSISSSRDSGSTRQSAPPPPPPPPPSSNNSDRSSISAASARSS